MDESKMDDTERFRLRFGPYQAPRVRVGERIECEVRGELIIGRWSDGPISWPQAKNPGGGGWMLIVCGDLARAVRLEANLAVAFHFGSNVKTVGQWRAALSVGTSTPGTKELRRAWVPFMLTEEDSALGRRNSLGSSAREGARPAVCKVNLRLRHGNARQWTAAELALLGKISDAEVGRRLQISTNAVGVARRARHLAPATDNTWRNRRDVLIPLDAKKMLARRLELNLSQKQVGQRLGKTAYYSKLETGQSGRVRAATLEALALALECAPELLIG